MTAESFIPLVSKWRPTLLSMSAHFLQDEEAAQDAVQEALTKLWLMWERLPARADAERMAQRLTKHECVNWLRAQSVRQHINLQAKEVADLHATSGDLVEADELRRMLESAVGSLTPTKRRLWEMFAEKGMKPTEIGAVTGRQPGAIRQMLNRIREEIIEKLRKGGYIDE